MRALWWLGGIVLGILVAGAIAAAVVPMAMRNGIELGIWFVWILMFLCIAAGVWAMERTRRDIAAKRAK